MSALHPVRDHHLRPADVATGVISATLAITFFTLALLAAL